MTEYKTLLLSKADRVAILTINRPEKLNTITVEMWQELEQAAKEIEAMDDLGAVVINASGDHFTAGIDLGVLNEFNSEFVMKNLSWAQSVYSKWEELSVPVIAAMQGVCYGSGIELALSLIHI